MRQRPTAPRQISTVTLGGPSAVALGEDSKRVLATLHVSRETEVRLQAYVDLLLKWQKKINLVAPSTVEHIWTRHILDCAQLMTLGVAHQAWADLGSGPGLPGLIIAVLAMEKPQVYHVHLIESDQRKASFLREAARLTGAPVTIHARRAEEVLPGLRGEVSAVTARALAPLPALLALAEPLLTTGAEGFFPKGETLSSEMQRATEVFSFGSRVVPSRSDERGRILIIRDVRRRSVPIGDVGDRK